MADTYYTITQEGEGLVREKMSRFLSFAMHVESADEAKALIKRYQNKYHDSRHVCWAYMIGPKREEWQLNDNGEPSGTAGKPILGQINSFNLTDVLVVVVRYFGGIKLGTSGLIAAYKEAAKEAIENAEITEMHEMKVFDVIFGYEIMDGIMRIVKSENLTPLEKVFDNMCRLRLQVRLDDAERMTGRLEEKGGKIEEIGA